jgi:phage host-nuclease inhibitor protein Gam
MLRKYSMVWGKRAAARREALKKAKEAVRKGAAEKAKEDARERAWRKELGAKRIRLTKKINREIGKAQQALDKKESALEAAYRNSNKFLKSQALPNSNTLEEIAKGHGKRAETAAEFLRRLRTLQQDIKSLNKKIDELEKTDPFILSVISQDK